MSGREDRAPLCVYEVYCAIHDRVTQTLARGEEPSGMVRAVAGVLPRDAVLSVGMAVVDARAGRPLRAKADLCRAFCPLTACAEHPQHQPA